MDLNELVKTNPSNVLVGLGTVVVILGAVVRRLCAWSPDVKVSGNLTIKFNTKPKGGLRPKRKSSCS